MQTAAAGGMRARVKTTACKASQGRNPLTAIYALCCHSNAGLLSAMRALIALRREQK